MEAETVAKRFIILGFSCLLLSISFGLIASLQYIFPGLLADRLSFQHTRPLHVFLAVNWIFSCVTGIVYHYIPRVGERSLYSVKLARVHLLLAVSTILIAIGGFLTGHFSGREYLEFPPWVTVIIVVYWLLFFANFIGTIKPRLAGAPVYIWSWCTGLVFFLITITEAHLWLLPYFNHNIIRDVTVQWKANGSMVGAWNMLIYGTAMYAMEQISGNNKVGYQKTSFAFYFLGLTNLMFNWGHHTYIVPASPAIKQVSYIISMTELILFANIIMKWKKGLLKSHADKYMLSTRFFKSADRWILINLGLAIAISIPYVNLYTHGTQVTVAHAMGTTIGINTMLLLASVAFIFEQRLKPAAKKYVLAGLTTMNISLLVFWLSLLAAGVVRSIGQYQHTYFAEVSARILPYLRVFSVAGVFLVTGVCLVAFNMLAVIVKKQKAAPLPVQDRKTDMLL